MKASDLKKHPLFKTYAAIANVCRISREAARKWNRVPLEHCAAIEAAANGEIRCELMRPDVVWQRDVNGAVVGYTVAAKARPVKRYRKAA